MAKNKKILLVSLSAGAGHVRVAQAIKKSADLNLPELEVKHIDMADYVSLPMKKASVSFYDFTAKKFPELWKFIYEKTDNPKAAKQFNKLIKIIKKTASSKLFQYISKYNPDHIIATHFLPATLVSQQKNIPVSYIFTDFLAHEFCLIPNLKYYFVPTEQVKDQLLKNQIPEEKIIISGIPLDPAFHSSTAAQQHNSARFTSKQAKTILVLAGGQGLIQSDEVVKKLFEFKDNINIIAIAGKNKALEDALKQLQAPGRINFKAIGWTDKMDEYMKMSDLIITKPGGVSIAECIALGKPIILVNPIPGQEQGNVGYVVENQFGLLADDLDGLLAKTKLLLNQKIQIKKQPPKRAAEIILKSI